MNFNYWWRCDDMDETNENIDLIFQLFVCFYVSHFRVFGQHIRTRPIFKKLNELLSSTALPLKHMLHRQPECNTESTMKVHSFTFSPPTRNLSCGQMSDQLYLSRYTLQSRDNFNYSRESTFKIAFRIAPASLATHNDRLFSIYFSCDTCI